MKPFNPPLVEPNLAYVENFASKHGMPTDVMMTGVTESITEMALFIDDSVVERFYLKDCDRLTDHYREVVEFVGYGPRGFGELIYSEACQLAKAEGKTREDVVVGLSHDLFERIGSFVSPAVSYTLKIVVDPSLSGIAYSISIPDPPSE